MKYNNGHFDSKEFLDAFKAGDQIAFRDFFDKTVKLTTYLLVRKHSTRLQYYEIEDVVSVAYCKIYKAREKMTGYEHMVASLQQAIYHQATDYLKKRDFRIRTEKKWFFTTEAYGVTDPTQELPDNIEQLPEAISKLPSIRKRVFELSFFKHKTIAEIAELLKIRPQTVRNHRSDAVASIRKFLLIKDYHTTSHHIII